jgi:serine acetyltransferase
VVSGISVIGENLTLTGGNTIGIKKKCQHGDLKIGDNCTMGANAVIIGPAELGNNISIGALACVTKSFMEDNLVLIGAPAKRLK